jgi:hypothetical protein
MGSSLKFVSTGEVAICSGLVICKTSGKPKAGKRAAATLNQPARLTPSALFFGGWATSVRPLALRPRIAPGLLLSEKMVITKTKTPLRANRRRVKGQLATLDQQARLTPSSLFFGGWAASIRPLALRPRIASGLLLSEI